MGMVIDEEYFRRRIERHCRVLQIVPFVKMVAVCNSVAMGEFDEESDIDLFVVARRGRLFLVRFLITMIMQVKGVRRHDEKVRGRFCLSFFVDERAANLETIAIERDIYLAKWIVSLWPVIEDDGYGDIFVSENEWIYRELINEKRELNRESLVKKGWFYSQVRAVLGWLLGSRFGDWFEKRMREWQLRRFKKKFVETDKNRDGGVIVNELMLKFHERDRRREYRDENGS